MMKVTMPPVKLGSRYRVTFLDENDQRIPAKTLDGKDFWGGTWHSNMITDAGLDELTATYSIPRSHTGQNARVTGGIRDYLAVSESLQEVKEKSSPVTAAQSGTTVTASASFFAAGDVGKALVFPDGSNGRVTSYTSATEVEVDTSQTVASSVFERWHIDLTALPGPEDETNSDGGFWHNGDYTYANSLFNVSLMVTRVCTLQDNRNVTGFGMRRNNTSAPLSIVDVLRDPSGAPITVSLVAGKKVRVDHALVFIGTSEPFEQTISVDEYDAANQLVSQTPVDVDAWLTSQYVSLTGDYIQRLGMSALDPGLRLAESSAHSVQFIFDNTDATPGTIGVGSPISMSSVRAMDANVAAYVPGSRRRSWSAVWPENLGNDDIYAVLMGHNNGLCMQFKDGYYITKTSDYTLEFGMELQWDRDYTP